MKPIEPMLSIQPVTIEDSDVLVPLLNEIMAETPYSQPFNQTTIGHEVFSTNPPTRYPVRWQKHHQLGAWQAGRLIGFLDAAVGFDSQSLHLPDYQPLGLLRFMALPPNSKQAYQVGSALLKAAEQFWREAKARHVRAFHISTGYPSWQAGTGLLPTNWMAHTRTLTDAHYQLSQRYYCLARPLNHLITETLPLAELNLVHRGTIHDRIYELYKRIEWVGNARLVHLSLDVVNQPRAIVYLAELYIEDRWRTQDVGKWLLRRMINDATLQGYEQFVVYLPHGLDPAMNLFMQQGFQELNYRGYVLEKRLN